MSKAALEALGTLEDPDSGGSRLTQMVREWVHASLARSLVAEEPKLVVDLSGASFRGLDLRNARLGRLPLPFCDR